MGEVTKFVGTGTLPVKCGSVYYSSEDWYENNSTLTVGEFFTAIRKIQWRASMTHFTVIEGGEAVMKFHASARKVHEWLLARAKSVGHKDDDVRIMHYSGDNRYTLQFLSQYVDECVAAHSELLR